MIRILSNIPKKKKRGRFPQIDKISRQNPTVGNLFHDEKLHVFLGKSGIVMYAPNAHAKQRGECLSLCLGGYGQKGFPKGRRPILKAGSTVP